jgi:hypothetical protein
MSFRFFQNAERLLANSTVTLALTVVRPWFETTTLTRQQQQQQKKKGHV